MMTTLTKKIMITMKIMMTILTKKNMITMKIMMAAATAAEEASKTTTATSSKASLSLVDLVLDVPRPG